MQAEDDEEVLPPSSPTAASGSQSCVGCAGLIPRDWPRRFQHCHSGWPATEEAASTWGKNEMSLGGEKRNEPGDWKWGFFQLVHG